MFAIVTGYLQPCESIQQHLNATMTILFIPYLSHCLLKGPKSTNSKFRSHRPSIQIIAHLCIDFLKHRPSMSQLLSLMDDLRLRKASCNSSSSGGAIWQGPISPKWRLKGTSSINGRCSINCHVCDYGSVGWFKVQKQDMKFVLTSGSPGLPVVFFPWTDSGK